MSAVAALREAIISTDAAIMASVPAPKRAPNATQKAADVATAIASLNPAVAAFGKVLTGAAREDWASFRDSTLATLSGKSDKDFSSSEFGAIVSRFVSLRAALAQNGIALPPVMIPQLENSRGIPVWVYPLLAVAAIGGIVLWKL